MGVVQPAYAGGDLDAFVAKLTPTGTGLVYATYLGGSVGFNGEDAGAGIASDRVGNVFVTGYTQTNNFPTTPGAFDTTFNGSTDDAFVTKIGPQRSNTDLFHVLGHRQWGQGLGHRHWPRWQRLSHRSNRVGWLSDDARRFPTNFRRLG